MVSTNTWVLLTQSLSISMVGAERMKIAGALSQGDTPAERLQQIFMDKDNLICGGQEVRKILTGDPSVGGQRVNNWDMALEIAKKYLEECAVKIPEISGNIEKLKEDLKHADAASGVSDVDAETVKNAIVATVSKPNTMLNLDVAKLTLCGKDRLKYMTGTKSRANRKILKANGDDEAKAAQDPGWTPELLRGSYWKTLDQWELDIDALLGDKVKLEPKVVTAECNKLFFGVPFLPKEDLTKTYCDELCTNMGSNKKIINRVGYVGKDADTINKKIQEEGIKLKMWMDEKAECESAQAALTDFREVYNKLDNDITVAVKNEMDARDLYEEALESMIELEGHKEDNAERVEEAESGLQEAGILAADLKKEYDELKKDDADTRASLVALMKTFEEANVLIDNAMSAMSSFQKLKLLVGGTVKSMWSYFDQGVLQPLDKLGLQKGMPLDPYFETDYETVLEYEDLMGNMKELNDHCKNTAENAFKRVEKADLRSKLLDMCVFDEPETSTPPFGETVLQIGKTMKKHLETAQAWHDPFTGHDDYTAEKMKALAAAGEIPMLREIENAFGPAPYYADYLAKWKADDPNGFMGLLKSLEKILADLKALAEKLKKQVEDATAKINDLTGKKNVLKPKLLEALEGAKLAEQELEAARAQEASLAEQMEQAQIDLAALKAALDAAEAAWQLAVDTFDEQYKFATNMISK